MDWPILLALIVVALVTLMLSGIPVVFSLGLMGLILAIVAWGPAGVYNIAAVAFGNVNAFTLVAVPLFIFMAETINRTGIGDDAFQMLHNWIGPIRGGLGVAGVLACALFAAVCGASAATTAAIGAIAVPAMLKAGYDKRLATGTIAAGGALGILIPPSILMIIYGELTAQSIGRLFIGGIVPGLMLVTFFSVYILFRCWKNPSLGPAAKVNLSVVDKFRTSWKVIPVIMIAVSMLGGIYTGVASTSEIAAVGALAALLIGIGYGKINWSSLKASFFATTETTVFVLWILVAALMFGSVLSHLQLPQNLAIWITSLNVSPFSVLIIINIIILMLGCIMDTGSIIMVTIPIFAPIVQYLGFDLVWFGVMIVVNMETANITPPFGLNLFIMKGIAPPEVSMKDIIWGAMPFALLEIIGLALVIIFPQIIMWLPNRMMGIYS
ncbi:TRAP transporter large permease subunit [Chloroflexota bacterium]